MIEVKLDLDGLIDIVLFHEYYCCDRFGNNASVSLVVPLECLKASACWLTLVFTTTAGKMAELPSSFHAMKHQSISEYLCETKKLKDGYLVFTFSNVYIHSEVE